MKFFFLLGSILFVSHLPCSLPIALACPGEVGVVYEYVCEPTVKDPQTGIPYVSHERTIRLSRNKGLDGFSNYTIHETLSNVRKGALTAQGGVRNYIRKDAWPYPEIEDSFASGPGEKKAQCFGNRVSFTGASKRQKNSGPSSFKFEFAYQFSPDFSLLHREAKYNKASFVEKCSRTQSVQEAPRQAATQNPVQIPSYPDALNQKLLSCPGQLGVIYPYLCSIQIAPDVYIPHRQVSIYKGADVENFAYYVIVEQILKEAELQNPLADWNDFKLNATVYTGGTQRPKASCDQTQLKIKTGPGNGFPSELTHYNKVTEVGYHFSPDYFQMTRTTERHHSKIRAQEYCTLVQPVEDSNLSEESVDPPMKKRRLNPSETSQVLEPQDHFDKRGGQEGVGPENDLNPFASISDEAFLNILDEVLAEEGMSTPSNNNNHMDMNFHLSSDQEGTSTLFPDLNQEGEPWF